MVAKMYVIYIIYIAYQSFSHVDHWINIFTFLKIDSFVNLILQISEQLRFLKHLHGTITERVTCWMGNHTATLCIPPLGQFKFRLLVFEVSRYHLVWSLVSSIEAHILWWFLKFLTTTLHDPPLLKLFCGFLSPPFAIPFGSIQAFTLWQIFEVSNCNLGGCSFASTIQAWTLMFQSNFLPQPIACSICGDLIIASSTIFWSLWVDVKCNNRM